MNIELRKNGTFYLKDSVYNPVTKLPKNTSIYLGSNPIQAKNKLKTLTDDETLLNQIPDTLLYEVELNRAIKNHQKLNHFQTDGINSLVKNYLNALLDAQQFINMAKEGVVAPSIDCDSCRFKNADRCDHFKQKFINGNRRYKNGRPVRCPAYELGQNKSMKGSIKLPCDFR